MANKIYYYDDDFFKNIDSEEKAYYLGFLYADGYINDIGYNCYVELTLQKEDEYILEKFLNILKSNRKIIRIRNDKYSRIIINSKEIVKDLKNMGCINKKTHKLIFPQNIDKNLIHHMIRGYFDGDGCIWHKRGTNDYQFQITGNVDFISGIENYLLCHLNIDKKEHYSPCNKNRKNNIRALKYGGNQITTKICELLYADSTIYLSKKYEKFLLAKKNIKEENRIVVFEGNSYDLYNKSKLINIIQERINVKNYTISSRMKKGWTPEKIIEYYK